MSSARIDETFMADLETKLAAIDSEYTPTCRSAPYGNGCPGANDASVDFWRAAADCVPIMLAELRERRAADLSPAEGDAIWTLREHLRIALERPEAIHREWKEQSLAFLDRLLGHKERP